MTCTFHIRPSTRADLAKVDALLARSYPKLLKGEYAPSVLVTALPLIMRAQPALLACGTYYVAETEDEDIVGAGGWTRDRRRRALGHIRHVASDDRQQRQGIGRALLSRCFDTARAAGVRKMECWSTYTAVPFYEAMGFRQMGPIDVPLRAGITFPSVRMMQDIN